MLLQSILDQLDDELARLFHLRTIIAALERPATQEPDAVALEPDALAQESDAAAEDPISDTPARSQQSGEGVGAATIQDDKQGTAVKRPRSAARVRRPVPPVESSPVRHVPAGPIVVSASELQREREQRSLRAREEAEPLPAGAPRQEINSESAARLLAARWLAGGRQDDPLRLNP